MILLAGLEVVHFSCTSPSSLPLINHLTKMMKSNPNDLMRPTLANKNGWFWGGKRLIKDKNLS
jgi:hypothetical protein